MAIAMMRPTPCPFCGEQTYFDGQRRYWWPECWPNVHECRLELKTPPVDRKKAAPEVRKVIEDQGLNL